MSDTSYFILKEDNSLSSQSDLESPKCKNNQSANQSLSQLNVALGLVVCLTVLTGGVFLMTGQQMDVTKAGLDWRNQTHLTLDTRSVPCNVHNMSHHQSARDQVNASRNQSVSLSQESSVNETLRVKRHNLQVLKFFGIHILSPKTTPTPWI